MSQIRNGALLNYANIFLSNIVGLLLTPFMILKLGDSEYGLYTLIGSFVGYISVLDFGLNNTIVRFISKYRATNDKRGEENFLATSFFIYGGISLIVILIGVICYFNIENIFSESLSSSEIDKAKIMFAILIFNLAITLPGGAFQGICFGYESFTYPKTINIVRYFIRSLMVLALLFFGGKAISIVILDTTLNLIIIAANSYYVFRKLKVRVVTHELNTDLVKIIFSYSIWIFLSALVSQFQWKVGQMVLGVYTNTTTVAIFAIGIVLGTYYGAFSGAISGVFLPRATQMTFKKATGEDLTDMMIKIGRISLIVLLFILGAFLLYGKQFVYLWVGETYHNAWIIASIIMVVYTPALVQAFGKSILEAKNKVAFRVILYLICIGGGTAVGGYLSKQYGEIGMILGSSAGWIIGQIILNIYYHKVIKLNILRFYKELSHKTIIVFLMVCAIGYIFRFIPGDGWFNFFGKGILYSTLYSFLIYKFGTLEYEKKLISKPIIKAFSKFKSYA